MFHSLRGNDHVQQHWQIIDEISAKWKTYPEVIGIAVLGGAARSYADAFSDIDIAVIVERPAAQIRSGEVTYKGFNVDIMQRMYWEMLNQDWDDIQRQAYSEANIIYDPSGRVAQLLAQKVPLTDHEQTARIVSGLVHLGWQGFAYQGRVDKEWRGYRWPFPSDLWLRRGSVRTAHAVLNHCLDLLVGLLYAANKSLQPDYKWRYFYVDALPWLPNDFGARYTDALRVAAIDEAEARRRIAVVQGLVDDTVDYLLAQNLLPDDVYSFFVEHVGVYRLAFGENAWQAQSN